jgi:hypothetical protein
MIAARKRVKKYRSEGGAADLIRVEVLVPPSARREILAIAARLRGEHRRNKELRSLYEHALQTYRARILDNVDLDRLPDLRARASVVARALIDRGDARAFAIGRRMLDHVSAMAG